MLAWAASGCLHAIGARPTIGLHPSRRRVPRRDMRCVYLMLLLLQSCVYAKLTTSHFWPLARILQCWLNDRSKPCHLCSWQILQRVLRMPLLLLHPLEPPRTPLLLAARVASNALPSMPHNAATVDSLPAWRNMCGRKRGADESWVDWMKQTATEQKDLLERTGVKD